MSTTIPYPEWKRQQELRAARKRHKPKQASNGMRITDPGPVTQVRLVIHAPNRQKRIDAYEALQKSATLPIYVRKYKYHDTKQTACMRGEFTIEAPFIVVQSIESELAPTWQRGKLDA